MNKFNYHYIVNTVYSLNIIGECCYLYQLQIIIN